MSTMFMLITGITVIISTTLPSVFSKAAPVEVGTSCAGPSRLEIILVRIFHSFAQLSPKRAKVCLQRFVETWTLAPYCFKYPL